jgi:ssDNA-binding Zn-finger/Zn-ribbon topoisomerase 1
MPIKCSVFGHRYGDGEITRDREERGSEVVTTITETETCERCGETRVVSENTEVTTLETPSHIVEDAADGPGDGGDGGDETSTPDGPVTSDRLVDEAESGADPPDGPAGGSAESGADPPDGPAGGSAESGADPDGMPGAQGGDDAIILEETSGSDEDDSRKREPGEWPDEGEEEQVDDEWRPDTTNMTETGDDGLPSVESEQPAFERTGQAASVPEGEFYCPECGFTTAVESSSLREGDFCPECHRGALEHYPDDRQ